MKLFFWRTGLGALTLLLFFHQTTARTQTPATNHVLQLSGGTNSGLELPRGAFNDVEEATIEGWVNWHDSKPDARFFDFGQVSRAIYVARDSNSPAVKLEIAYSTAKKVTIRAADLLLIQ